jgi:hypothetical protein
LSPHHIIPSTPPYPFTMVDGGLLAQLVTAVQGARSAFQSLCSATHVSDAEPRDLMVLDVSLQSLSTMVEIFDSVDPSGGQLDLVISTLSTPTIVSAAGGHISVADAMIVDMHNLEQRLTDVLHDITTVGPRHPLTPVKPIPLGEAMAIRAMIEKYCSLICEVSSWQRMYVMAL